MLGLLILRECYIIAGPETLDSQIIGTYLLNIDASLLSLFVFLNN